MSRRNTQVKAGSMLVINDKEFRFVEYKSSKFAMEHNNIYKNIIDLISETENISAIDIRSHSRKGHLVRCRCYATGIIEIIKDDLQVKTVYYSGLARYMNNRNHTSTLNSLNAHRNFIQTDDEYKSKFEIIKDSFFKKYKIKEPSEMYYTASYYTEAELLDKLKQKINEIETK